MFLVGKRRVCFGSFDSFVIFYFFCFMLEIVVS